MPIRFADYRNHKIDCETGTPGGDTYVVNDKFKCFRFTRSHRRAVWQLTGEISAKVEDIDDASVDQMLAAGKILINDDDCVPGHGWMGCKVWDGNKEYIGAVGDRCSRSAGSETEHKGYGRCRFHRGNLKGSLKGGMTTGRNSKTFKRLVQDKIMAYAADPSRMDLSRELGVQRTMLDLLLNLLDEDTNDPAIIPLIAQISDMASQVARLADKMSAIDHRTALTANQIVYVQATVIDVMRRHLPQDALQKAAMELSERLGTKQAFGSAVVEMLGSGEKIVPMQTTKRVINRVIDN